MYGLRDRFSAIGASAASEVFCAGTPVGIAINVADDVDSPGCVEVSLLNSFAVGVASRWFNFAGVPKGSLRLLDVDDCSGGAGVGGFPERHAPLHPNIAWQIG